MRNALKSLIGRKLLPPADKGIAATQGSVLKGLRLKGGFKGALQPGDYTSRSAQWEPDVIQVMAMPDYLDLPDYLYSCGAIDLSEWERRLLGKLTE